ncbi:hypothetical protein JCM5353_008611 [Sporobolomyces roseus]
MSLTTDDSKLFKSDAQHRKAAIREARAEALQNVGNPIQLPTKPLRVRVRQNEDKGKEPDAWIAESGFVVRRIGLESGKTKQIYRGHCGPVTSLDFYTTRTAKRELMISGSWDKSFRIWDIQTKQSISTTVAHIDFIKTLVVIPDFDILVTASSDRDIRIWDLSSLDSFDFSTLLPATTQPTKEPQLVPTESAPKQGAAPPSAVAQAPLPLLLILKSHTRPIEQLAYFPGPSSSSSDAPPLTDKFGLISADSMGVLKVWELTRDAAGGEGKGLKGTEKSSVRHHELAIYDLIIGSEGEIWTASADNSVLLSSFSPSDLSLPPTPILRIPHHTQTRALLSLPISVPTLNASYLLTTSSDELIRIFDLNSDPLEPAKSREERRQWKGLSGLKEGDELPGCVKEIEGHTNEVVSLSSYILENEEGRKEVWIASAGLDGTLRRWKWTEMLESKREKLVLIEVNNEEEVKESLLTEEEERELEELMADD